MCIHHSQHMALVYVKNLPFWTPNIFRSLRYTHLWFWGVEFNTHVSDIFTIIKAHCHLDGFWCSSTPLRLLKSFCNPPLILTPLQGCALCSLAFPLTLFFLKEYDICENVCSWWKESQVVLGEDGPHSPPWWGMQRVCLSRVLLLEEFWRGNHRWQLHLGELKSVPWAVTVHIVTRWSPSPSCKHLCKAAPTAHVAPYSGWHMGHDLPMLSAKSTIDQSSTEWWALTLMESSGGTFNMAVWQRWGSSVTKCTPAELFILEWICVVLTVIIPVIPWDWAVEVEVNFF